MSFISHLCWGLVLCAFLPAMISAAAHGQTQASCHFKLFQLPEATYASQPFGINDGTVVGMAVSFGGIERAFTRSPDGVITYYSAPNTTPTYNSYTYFTGRNESGVSVGSYKTPNSNPSVPEGFIRNGSTFTSIVEPKSVWGTNANGINKWKTVVGSYLDYYSKAHGFQRFSNGSFITLNYPGAQNTLPAAINDNGVIVGSYSGGHGFIYFQEQWSTLDYPKATSTTLNGISNDGVIIGRSDTTKQGTAFLYENGIFKVIAVPNSFSTSADGIGADGLITGTTNLDGTAAGRRGFTATCN